MSSTQSWKVVPKSVPAPLTKLKLLHRKLTSMQVGEYQWPLLLLHLLFSPEREAQVFSPEGEAQVFSPEGEAQVAVPGSSHHTGEGLREGERRWKPDHPQNEKQLVEVVHSATSESLKPGRSCQFLGLMRTTVYTPRQPPYICYFYGVTWLRGLTWPTAASLKLRDGFLSQTNNIHMCLCFVNKHSTLLCI